MSSGLSQLSESTLASPTIKKKGIKKRLVKLFSRSEGNLKEKYHTASDGDNCFTEDVSMSTVEEGHLVKKGRSSWSEKRGKKERSDAENERQGWGHSLPRLRYHRAEDSMSRSSKRASKTRSLSSSEMNLPAPGFLQRFGSLTWRKKKPSVLDGSGLASPESTLVDTHWSLGQLNRPVDSVSDLKDERPKSCYVEALFTESALESSDFCPKDNQNIQKNLEISATFDCLADSTVSYCSSEEDAGDKITQLQSFMSSNEKEENEQVVLPFWAQSILKEYMPEYHKPQPSPVLKKQEEGEEDKCLHGELTYNTSQVTMTEEQINSAPHSPSQSEKSLEPYQYSQTHPKCPSSENEEQDTPQLNPPYPAVQEEALAQNVTESQATPGPHKVRYEIIITMKKEGQMDETDVPELGGAMSIGEELVGPDLNLSPSLECQACGHHRAGTTALTAHAHTEQPKNYTNLEDEKISELRGGETCVRAHLDRDISLAGDEQQDLLVCEQTPEHYRSQSPNMEKKCSLDNEHSHSPGRAQPSRMHHTKKEHGKVNPRPGKVLLFSDLGFNGKCYEINGNVSDTSEWELQETISIRVIRGGWILYEEPRFHGRRVMLLEGDAELKCPWLEHTDSNREPQTTSAFWVGSLRHVVRDFRVPKISLFLQPNGEGEKVQIEGAAPDMSEYGGTIKTESIIVHCGMWLVFSKPLYQGDPYILEPGGYPNRRSWGAEDPQVCSLEAARIGGPIVEKPNEPKLLLFQMPEFEGTCLEVTRDMNSIQGEHNLQGEKLYSVGSLKVVGGCWVGYEKEGFRGHQYLLEEGDFNDFSDWGGCTEELGSVRLIRTDFSQPEIVLYELPGCLEGPCLRLSESLADLEEAQYGTRTGSIHVLSGVWVAYENVDFSGEQYILEKGVYHNYQDWGAENGKISSVQPVIQVGGNSLHFLAKIHMFSEPNFYGDCLTCIGGHMELPELFSLQSCRVECGSWSLYEGENQSGEQYILSEGEYPTRTAMGCLTPCPLRSLKMVPLYFSIPSLSLHGLERFEGKELDFTEEVRSLQGEGYNNHVMSVSVKSGIWVVYEHSDFRGRQWLLERKQIPNWLLYSGLQRIGSLCPIRQRTVYFRLRNRNLGLFLCVAELTEDMKAARVLVTEPQDGRCLLWYYEEGRLKNQMAPHMNLQVIGQSSSGTKVVLWSESRKPIQTWNLEDSGCITSCLFKGMCLDVKGGQCYDSDHVIIWETTEDRLTQQWDLEVF